MSTLILDVPPTSKFKELLNSILQILKNVNKNVVLHIQPIM